jgi:outer membrane protein assembly factor BamB
MDSVEEIIQTKDGGYALVGYNNDGSYVSGFDLYMIKIDETGKLDWQKSYEGSRKDDYTMGQSFVQLADESYIIVGEEEGLASSSLPDQAVIFKVNKNGDLQWSRTFSDKCDQKFKCVQLTYDGGLIIVGNRSPHGDYETSSIYVVKTDINGKINTTTK